MSNKIPNNYTHCNIFKINCIWWQQSTGSKGCQVITQANSSGCYGFPIRLTPLYIPGTCFIIIELTTGRVHTHRYMHTVLESTVVDGEGVGSLVVKLTGKICDAYMGFLNVSEKALKISKK